MIAQANLDSMISAETRQDAWIAFVNQQHVRQVAEIGVYRGSFAEAILDACPDVECYYMVDPWRHLDDWNKPANKEDDVFGVYFAEAMRRTQANAHKRVVLRGRTSEVVDRIPDGGLDLAYIDGDHTLRGITIDLIRLWPKVRAGGFLGGDDLNRCAFHHGESFEPTLVFPFAVYFAEAVDAPIYLLPHNQFLIQKTACGFSATDLASKYVDLTVSGTLKVGPIRESVARRMWRHLSER